MHVSEVKKQIRVAKWQEIQEYLMLIDALQDLKEIKRTSYTNKLGWKTRDVRRGSVLAALNRTSMLFQIQVEEARKILVNYAGQIQKYRGKVQPRNEELRYDEETLAWLSSIPTRMKGRKSIGAKK